MSDIPTIVYRGTVSSGLLKTAFRSGNINKIKELDNLALAKLQRHHLGLPDAAPQSLVFGVSGGEKYITYYIAEKGGVFCFTDDAKLDHSNFSNYLDQFASPGNSSISKPAHPCLEIL